MAQSGVLQTEPVSASRTLLLRKRCEASAWLRHGVNESVGVPL